MVCKGTGDRGQQENGYDFQWRFATWTTQLNGSDVPVLGYLVRDVVAPPSPAEKSSSSPRRWRRPAAAPPPLGLRWRGTPGQRRPRGQGLPCGRQGRKTPSPSRPSPLSTTTVAGKSGGPTPSTCWRPRSGKKSAQDISLNEPIDTDQDGNTLTILDTMAVDDTIIEEIDTRMKSERLYGLVRSVLTPRERTIICLRYGLGAPM